MMKRYISLFTFVILLGGCGGTAQTNPSATATPKANSSPTPKAAFSPIPDGSGLILQCNRCAFLEDKEGRYVAGQLHNDAKQAISGYVMVIDLLDAKGKSIKKFDGLMLMDAMSLQAGENKDFKQRILSKETNVTQATIYFKKAGTDVKLSNALTLKLNAPAATATPIKSPIRPTQ